jgi:hypothetical protein
MPEVKNRKIIHVSGYIDTTGGVVPNDLAIPPVLAVLVPATFDQTLRVGFDVHDMIVTSWTCSGAVAGSGEDTYFLRMNGIGDLFHFRETDSVAIKNIFRVGKNLDGVQEFQVMQIDGKIASNIQEMYIVFTLEFIEFHK